MAVEDDFNVEQILEYEERSPWRMIGWWFTGFLCFGAVLIIILHFGELGKFLEVIRNTRPQWLILAALLQALSYVSATGVWYLALRTSGHPIAFRSLYPLSIAQLFAKQALPSSGLSGVFLVVKGLLNRHVPEPVGMGCMLAGAISYYIAYMLSVLISLTVLAFYHLLTLPLLIMAFILCLVAIGVPASVLKLRTLGMHHRLPAFVMRWKPAKTILRVLAEAPVHLLRNYPLLTKISLLQISVYCIDSATLLIMLHAVGYAQPYLVVFASFVMAAVVGTVLPIPLGLGTFEGTCVTMLHLFKVPLEPALIAVLLLRGFTFWLPMLPGLWLARRELRHPVKARVGRHI